MTQRRLTKPERFGAKQTLLSASEKGSPYLSTGGLAVHIYIAYSGRKKCTP